MAMKNILQTTLRKPEEIKVGLMEVRQQGWYKKTQVAA